MSGKIAVKEAIECGTPLDRIYLHNTAHGRLIEEIRQLATDHRIPINKVPVEKLNALNVGDHEGVVALLARVHYYELQQIISFVIEKGENPLFLLLDGVTDIRNIGGIARTSYCCGVHALVIPDKGVGALNDDAILTSAGALEKIPVCRVNSLVKAVDELHLNGIKVFATEMHASLNVFDSNFNEPSAIIVGNEEKGIHPALVRMADEKIKIPMSGDFESLNVGVATGMILYEVMKQRMQAG